MAAFSIDCVGGLTTHQPLKVILCRLPEKGRKEIEEVVEEMKERDNNKYCPPFSFSCFPDCAPYRRVCSLLEQFVSSIDISTNNTVKQGCLSQDIRDINLKIM